MKKKIILTLSFCLFLGVSKVGATPIDPSFKDDNFYACVVRNYNSENGTHLTVKDNLSEEEVYLDTIEHLTCSNQEIVDVTGIEKLTSLQTIDLSNNNISSIKIIESHILEKLNLSNNNIKSLSLGNMRSLNTLKIDNNGMEYLSINGYIESISLYNNNFLKNVELKVGEELNRSDYINLDSQDGYSIKYEIADTEVAEYDDVTGKIVGKNVGITTALLTIEGTLNENGEVAPVTFESTITVTGNDVVKEESKEENKNIENPDTGVITFAVIDALILLIAIVSYIIVRKNKYNKI